MLMSLDMRTVLFEGAFTCLTIAGIMIYYSVARKSYPGFHYWTIGYSSGGLGAAFITLRGHIPDFISIVLANSMIMAMPFLLVFGLSTLAGRGWREKNYYIALLVIVICLFFYMTYITPNVSARIGLINFFYIVLMIEALRITIIFLPEKTGGQNYLLIFMISATIIPCAYRLATALTQGQHLTFLVRPGDLQCIAVLASILFTAGTMIALIILNAQLMEIELREAKKTVEALANHDALTDLYNRRYFDTILEQEFYRLQRHAQPLSIIIADIDFFKNFNDTYGHQAGDECLKEIADALRNAATRASDIAVRYGGEEFVLLLPETDNRGANKVARTLFRLVRQKSIPHASSTASTFVTLSAGIATIRPGQHLAPDMLITLADKALYHSKATGRNRFANRLPEDDETT